MIAVRLYKVLCVSGKHLAACFSIPLSIQRICPCRFMQAAAKVRWAAVNWGNRIGVSLVRRFGARGTATHAILVI